LYRKIKISRKSTKKTTKPKAIRLIFVALLNLRNKIKNMDTTTAYNLIVDKCKNLFLRKAKDYGTAWTILRMPSVTDQIGIKADRIRTLQETQENKVGDSIEDEFMGIINYCLIALMLLELQEKPHLDLQSMDILKEKYEEKVDVVRNTMHKKNHDYGEAWRKMRVSSITDLILMKILRLKQIEDNAGKTLVSEGADANYTDIMNYAIFALILMEK
jgi:Nucleotide modification associated domain 1